MLGDLEEMLEDGLMYLEGHRDVIYRQVTDAYVA